MNTLSVRIARVYLTACKKDTDKMLDHLKTTLHIRGATVFRAISGYGDAAAHNTMLMDILLELPIVIEFFDETTKVMLALDYLNSLVRPEHIVYWDAEANT